MFINTFIQEVHLYRLLKELSCTKDYLSSIIDKTQQYITNAPTENLRVTSSKNKRKYYLCSEQIKETKANGQYLKKDEKHIANAIAMRDYAMALGISAQKIMNKIEDLQAAIAANAPENVYAGLKYYRKELVIPIVPEQLTQINTWQNQSFTGKRFADCTAEIYSERGERVRSKSEKIIADFLLKNNVPYLYEKPLSITTNYQTAFTVYPDFTILDINNRREIYLEHFGRMDDLSYVQKMVKKVNSYERAGIFPGDRLLCTFETNACPFDSRILEGILRNADILT